MELKDCTFGEHFQFPPHVEEDALGVKLLFKAAVTSYDSVNKEIDEMVIREIVKAAKDNGVTDLTILNRKFIMDALFEKRDRMNGNADAVPVIRCRDCKFSEPPDILTKLYGEPGTLTCTHGACNSRNVGSDFFCADGEEKEI